MVNIKPTSDIAKKWSDVTPVRASYYAAGVQAPRTPWAAAAQGAKANFKAAVTSADIDARFSAGVSKAGDEKWKRGAVQKGQARFGPGVQAAAQDYATAIEPFAQTIQSTVLPARQPRGSPANYARSQKMGEALAAKKTAMRGGGRA